MKRRLAIVPAYNEAGAVGATVAGIRRCAPDFDVLVVDDGSSDATGELARAAGATVLRLPFNLGIGGAMQAGYIYARENGYEVAVQVDGDGQHDPRFIHELLARLGRKPSRWWFRHQRDRRLFPLRYDVKLHMSGSRIPTWTASANLPGRGSYTRAREVDHRLQSRRD